MKKLIRFICMISLIAVAVIGTAGVKTNVSGEKLGDIPFDTIMYTKNDIDRLMAGGIICSCPSNVVALFTIQLNYNSSGPYDHFELKASTNNFSHSVSEYVRLQYYSQSEIADKGVTIGETVALNSGNTNINSAVDRMWMFVETTAHDNPSNVHFDGDVRSWYYIGSTLSGIGQWLHKPTTVMVLVDTTCLERHKEKYVGEWLNKNDYELVWSWTRYYYDGTERHSEIDEETGSGIWRPIAPTRWYPSVPNWAREQIPDFQN